MSNRYLDQTRELGQRIGRGEHALSNDTLRQVYGISRVTARSRAEIAEAFRASGFEVLSDPASAPLIVRRREGARGVGGKGGETPWWKRRWVIVTAAILALLLIVGALGDSETDQSADSEPAALTETTGADEPVAEDPAATFAEAAEEVDEDHYGAALALAASLGEDDENRLRRRIAGRLARRAIYAVGIGNRGRARRLLRRANQYPQTPAVTRARSSLRSAERRAARRAELRRQQRAAARRAAAEARAAERRAAEAAAAQAVAAPETSGPSTYNWCGKRDGDGDGLYCEDE